MWLWSAIVLAIIAGIIVFALLRGSLTEPKDVAGLVASLRPVNPKSLAQLTSQADDSLLRRRLTKRQYRRLRIQRNFVIRSYCLVALRNCSVLQIYGQVLQRESDLETRKFGRELASVCLSLRLRLLAAVLSAQLEILVPAFEMDLATISRIYASAGRHLMNSPQCRASLARVLEQAFPAA